MINRDGYTGILNFIPSHSLTKKLAQAVSQLYLVKITNETNPRRFEKIARICWVPWGKRLTTISARIILPCRKVYKKQRKATATVAVLTISGVPAMGALKRPRANTSAPIHSATKRINVTPIPLSSMLKYSSKCPILKPLPILHSYSSSMLSPTKTVRHCIALRWINLVTWPKWPPHSNACTDIFKPHSN